MAAMQDTASADLNADDFLTFLEVARTGRYSAAAERLSVNHTTVSRRIARLEDALNGRVLARGPLGAWEATKLGERLLEAAHQIEAAVKSVVVENPDGTISGTVRVSAPDGFASYILAPAAAMVRKQFPLISIEIVTMTRRALQQRSDIDIEVVVGEPQVNRAETMQLCEYMYGLYASKEYLESRPAPTDMESLGTHPIIYFADTMLQVDALDVLPKFDVARQSTISGSNTFVHVEATRAGAGIGLLASYMAGRHSELVRVMRGVIDIPLSYWLVSRSDTLQRPEVAVLIRELKAMAEAMQSDLSGAED
ncbi:MAG: LysR family transcriptional regulator [Leucobacter sp.]